MTIAAVLLAAGDGSRFEGAEHKLRSEIDGRAVLLRSLDACLDAGFDEVVVVVGADGFADLLPDGLTVIESPEWELGQGHSLAAAVSYARSGGHEAIVVGVADQPLVGASTWRALRVADETPIVVATYAGRRRPPTRLDSSTWDDLPTSGDEGARSLIEARPELVSEVASAGDPRDVDTLEALEEVRQLHRDRVEVQELLGREPMGPFEVVVRDERGRPSVLKNFPLLADGRPMPTLYWLCGERETLLVGRLEAQHGVRRAEAEIGLTAINEAHDRYAEQRDAVLDSSGVSPVHRPSGGVGGTRNGLKCLHAHYGYWLAGGDDPVGLWVDEHLAEVDSPEWPAS